MSIFELQSEIVLYCIVLLSWPGNPQELFGNDDGTLKDHRIPSRPRGRATSKAAVPPRFTSLFVIFLLFGVSSWCSLQVLYKFRVLYLFFFHFPTWLFPCYTIYLQLPTAIIWSIWQSQRKSEMHFEVLVISQPLSHIVNFVRDWQVVVIFWDIWCITLTGMLFVILQARERVLGMPYNLCFIIFS